MTRPRPQIQPGFSTRHAGLLVAAGVLLIGGGLVAILAVRGSGRSSGQSALPLPLGHQPAMPELPVDITQAGLANAGRARFQFVDRQDPTRVVGRLEWLSLDPLPGGRAAIDQPRATIYLDGGRRALIRAARGSVFMPSRDQPPESGTFEGGVTISLIDDSAAESSEQIDERSIVARLFTPSLRFDSALGEATFPGAFRASAAGLEMSARGLRIVGDQVNRRIALLHVEQTDYVRISPNTAANSPSPARPAAPTDADPKPRSQPDRIDDYQIAVRDGIQLARREATLRAGSLQVLARLVNSAFAPDAFGPPRGPAADDGTKAKPAASDRAASAPSTRPSAAQSLWARIQAATPAQPLEGEPASLYLTHPDEAIVVWSGPLTLRPTRQPAPELARDAVLVRLQAAEHTGQLDQIAIDDRELDASGRASVIEYGSTTRTVTLRGPSDDDSARVVLQLANRGAIVAPLLSFGLDSGVGQARGPGSLIAPEKPGEPNPPRLTWSDQADFELARRDGRPIGAIASAAFTGAVAATANEGSLNSGYLVARFASHPDQPGQTRLSQVIASERATMQTAGEPANTGQLAADSITIDFDTSAAEVRPMLVTATGSVRGSRDGWTLTTAMLEAALDADNSGRPVVQTIRAQRDVQLRNADTSLAAASLRADVPAQAVDFLGSPVSIARAGTTITGPAVRLDGLQRRLAVAGPGTLAFDRPESTSVTRVDASWTRGMTIDDTAGTAEISGDAIAMSNPGPLELDTIKADRINLEFTPLSNPSGDTARAFQRARATAAEGQIVRVESQRFLAGTTNTARTLDRLVYLEGKTVAIDDPAGRVEVPGPGKLLVDDRRTSSQPEAQPSPDEIPSLGTARGSTLFSWTGGLTFDRHQGLLTFASDPAGQSTRLLHRSAPGEPMIALDARTLEANLQLEDSTAGQPALDGRAQLLSARALGDVDVAFQTQRLQAERLNYDALTGRAEAAVDSADGRVVLSDPSKPQPISARRLSWDLRENRVTITEPAPIVIPR